jgi:hypothetical protein
VVEASGPTLESFEAEGERVLSWGEASTVINHGLLSGKHVPCFKVTHLVVTVAGSSDVFWPEVPLSVLF